MTQFLPQGRQCGYCAKHYDAMMDYYREKAAAGDDWAAAILKENR